MQSHRKLMIKALLLTVGLSSIATANEAGIPQAQHHIHYYDQVIPLELNTAQVAVFTDQNAVGGARMLDVAGMEALDVRNPDSRLVPIPGWSVASTPLARQSAVGIEQLVAELTLRNVADFVSPVFYDNFNGSLIVSRDIFIGFQNSVNLRAARTAITDAAIGTIIAENYGNMPGVFRVRAHSRNGFEVLEAANRMARLPQVRFAEPDMIFTGMHHVIPNDPLFDRVWGVHNTGQATGCPESAGVDDIDMNGPEAWDLESGDAGVIVVIIDSGYQLNHPDLNHSGNGADFTGEGGAGAPVHACDRHGTAVAGCVSALFNNNVDAVGIAPNCTVASARPFIPTETDAPCSGNWTTMASWNADAINWASTIGASVTNNSNGYGFTSALIETAYTTTRAAGIIHFASAGNSGTTTIGYPASLATVNSISAINKFGNLAGFSDSGTGLDFCAPGVEVITTDRTGADGYSANDWTCTQGTSFASPYAAGVAALVMSANAALTPDQVEQAMQASAKDLGASGYDTSFGFGLVNARGAVEAALGIDCNSNGVPDSTDIFNGTSSDCDGNNVPDECDIANGAPDCNSNGLPDSCDIANGTSQDCNSNGIPDECDIANGTPDCNSNGVPDSCDIASGTSQDCNNNGIPDECNDTPSNSSCATAQVVAVNSNTAGSNVNACVDAAPACGFVNMTRGVWYQVTGNGSRLAVSTCSASTFDTQIAVYTGACNALACLISNDDACSLRSYVEFCTMPGETYYIFVNAFSPAVSGTFTLAVTDIGSGFDCNCNGIEDSCDLEFDPSLDMNGDGWIDSCTACAGDTNCDGVINYLDVLNVFQNLNTDGPLGDVNYDGMVTILDYYVVAWNYGKICN